MLGGGGRTLKRAMGSQDHMCAYMRVFHSSERDQIIPVSRNWMLYQQFCTVFSYTLFSFMPESPHSQAGPKVRPELQESVILFLIPVHRNLSRFGLWGYTLSFHTPFLEPCAQL